MSFNRVTTHFIGVIRDRRFIPKEFKLEFFEKGSYNLVLHHYLDINILGVPKIITQRTLNEDNWIEVFSLINSKAYMYKYILDDPRSGAIIYTEFIGKVELVLTGKICVLVSDLKRSREMNGHHSEVVKIQNFPEKYKNGQVSSVVLYILHLLLSFSLFSVICLTVVIITSI